MIQFPDAWCWLKYFYLTLQSAWYYPCFLSSSYFLFCVKPTWNTAIAKCLLLQIIELVNCWLLLIVTVYFLKNLETHTKKPLCTKIYKKNIFKFEKSLCMKMLLSARAKPAHDEEGKQSYLTSLCWSGWKIFAVLCQYKFYLRKDRASA